MRMAAAGALEHDEVTILPYDLGEFVVTFLHQYKKLLLANHRFTHRPVFSALAVGQTLE